MSRKKIDLGPLSLPLEIVTESSAILARKRAGKSWTAGVIVERVVDAGEQVVILDPKGDWWGIRAAADGKGPGLALPIFGGDHGDVPILSGSGADLAGLLVRERASALVDVSDLRRTPAARGATPDFARFVGDFLAELHRLKRSDQYRTPLLLVVDEADMIAPQSPDAGEADMLAAMDAIVRRGGQRGLGTLVVTQRPAVISKNVLTQTSILFLLTMSGAQDVAALDAWTRVHGSKEEREILLGSVGSLPRGEAWCWAPGWPNEKGIFERFSVPAKRTFDSGATPKPGEAPKQPKILASVELAAFEKAMASAVEERKANDPKELRAKVAALERDLASEKARVENLGEELRCESERPPPEPVVEKVPILSERSERALAMLVETIERISTTQAREIAEFVREVEAKLVDVRAEIASATSIVMQPRTFKANLPLGTPTRELLNRGKKVDEIVRAHDARDTARLARDVDEKILRSTSSGELRDHWTELAPGEKSMLRAAATFAPKAIPRARLALLAGMAPKGGSFRTYLSRLNVLGLVEKRGDDVVATSSAVAILREVSNGRGIHAPRGADLVALWKDRLDGKAKDMLDALVQAGEAGLSRADLADAIGMGLGGGSFRTYLSRLAVAGLVEKERGSDLVRASEDLF